MLTMHPPAAASMAFSFFRILRRTHQMIFFTSPVSVFLNHSATNAYLQIFQSEIVRVLLSKLMPILTRCLPDD